MEDLFFQFLEEKKKEKFSMRDTMIMIGFAHYDEDYNNNGRDIVCCIEHLIYVPVVCSVCSK